jgi:hypothetical protein
MSWAVEINRGRFTSVVLTCYYGGVVYKSREGRQTRRADSRGWNSVFHVENHALIW